MVSLQNRCKLFALPLHTAGKLLVWYYCAGLAGLLDMLDIVEADDLTLAPVCTCEWQDVFLPWQVPAETGLLTPLSLLCSQGHFSNVSQRGERCRQASLLVILRMQMEAAISHNFYPSELQKKWNTEMAVGRHKLYSPSGKQTASKNPLKIHMHFISKSVSWRSWPLKI